MFHLEQTDCFDWLRQCPARSIHAVCTDPPYGILEFTEKELAKLRIGRGGVWRLPPKVGGSHRDPLPRFTILTDEQKQHLRDYFRDWGKLLLNALVPGAHVCVAGHPILQHHVQGAMTEAGFEVRPAIMRLYYSFRGGDRPKNAETEFPEVCVSPKGAYEPWMLFRKPIETKTVAENLRKWTTGGLRRLSLDKPLPDAIPSGRTPKREEAISNHPCLKPQHFMRLIVRALLPLGEGTILDPFMGSGSTIAAAEAIGYNSIGLELDAEYFQLAQKAVPRLAALYPCFNGQEIEIELNGNVEYESENQTAFVLAEKSPAYKVSRTGKRK
ncbi:MAG TPA: site-specific DNA-methyltransferase [Candidatus Aquilonibacter sp.]|nr:site-specific DNA-methyltransferase [Candidatus Aquilonibacter sp.]